MKRIILALILALSLSSLFTKLLFFIEADLGKASLVIEEFKNLNS